MHWNILDENRKSILPLLSHIVADHGFYLAGGTALALMLGHRDSIDFDFFTEQNLDTEKLFEELSKEFAGHNITKTQETPNTLGIVVDEAIKISFMTYSYTLLRPLVATEYFPLASIADIGCMKCSAITSRGAMKDYVDLYFILQTMSLKELLALSAVKYSTIDVNLIAKSLVYFEDLESEKILYKENHDVSFDTVKDFLKKQVAGI